MVSLVRNSNNSRPIGETSKVYKSRLSAVRVGDMVEITNRELEMLNVAKVIEVEDQQTIVIEIIA